MEHQKTYQMVHQMLFIQQLIRWIFDGVLGSASEGMISSALDDDGIFDGSLDGSKDGTLDGKGLLDGKSEGLFNTDGDINSYLDDRLEYLLAGKFDAD